MSGDEALSFGERLAAADLDEEARDNLGGQVIVSSDANHVFAYARNEVAARAAEAEIRRIVADVEIEATVALTRWHPIEEDWKDPATPMPSTPDEEAAERARRDAAEIAEEEESGEFDWEVAVHVDSIGDMRDLDKKLRESGLEVHRRWKYLLVGALAGPRADELADRIRKIAPARTPRWRSSSTPTTSPTLSSSPSARWPPPPRRRLTPAPGRTPADWNLQPSPQEEVRSRHPRRALPQIRLHSRQGRRRGLGRRGPSSVRGCSEIVRRLEP